jgi:hypothetical protein
MLPSLAFSPQVFAKVYFELPAITSPCSAELRAISPQIILATLTQVQTPVSKWSQTHAPLVEMANLAGQDMECLECQATKSLYFRTKRSLPSCLWPEASMFQLEVSRTVESLEFLGGLAQLGIFLTVVQRHSATPFRFQRFGIDFG